MKISKRMINIEKATKTPRFKIDACLQINDGRTFRYMKINNAYAWIGEGLWRSLQSL